MRFTASLDLGTTLSNILDSVRQLCEVDCAGVALFDEDRECLRYEAAAGPHSELLQGDAYRPDEGLIGLAFRTGRVVNSPDFPNDARRVDRRYAHAVAMGSMMLVPLHRGDEIVGVLASISPQPAYFTASRERLLTGLAEQAALAIEHA